MRLFVISETRLYREGLCELVGRRPGVEIVGSVAYPDVAVASILQMRRPPEVALIDIAGPSGFGVLDRLARDLPALTIVAITVQDHPDQVIRCAEAGAAGFVTPDASAEELIQILHSVTNGELMCSPRLAAALARRVRILARERTETSVLTEREREILGLIDAGLSNKMIADRLSIELPTVKNHVHRILEKLGVANRTQAVARMRRAEAY